MSLTISVVICNPDPELFKKFLISLVKFTPEMTQLLIYHNNLAGQDEGELMSFVSEIIPETVNLKIIHGPAGQNIGFGAAHNYNIKSATEEYFAILNDDIEFFEVWSTPMIKILSNTEALSFNPSDIAQVGMKRDTCSTWDRDGQGMPTDGEPEYIEASCLTGDTKISLLDGREVPIKDLVGEEYFHVYSCTTEGKIVSGRGHSCGITRKDVELIKVTLDTGEQIRCTKDHKFMLRSGQYTEAQYLRLGSSLMPLYRRIDKRGYEEIFDNQQRRYIKTHFIADQRNLDKKLYEHRLNDVRHHKDFNKRNNIPNNISVLNKDPRIMLKKIKSRIRKQVDKLLKLGLIINEDNWNGNRTIGTVGWNNIGKYDPEFSMNLNHQVVSIEEDGRYNVYDFTVDTYHNFALSSGIFVHNCLTMRTVIAKRYGPFDDAYKIGYNEDADLSLRLRKDGYQIAQVDLDWIHYRAKTSSRIPVDIEGFHVKNDVIFKARWGCYLHKRTFGRTIIVKRQGSIGDVFLTTPILRTLRAQNPRDEILVMTQAPQMLLACSDLDGFVPWGQPYSCDWLIDLDYAYEKDFRKHIIEAYSEVSGITPHYNRGILYVDKARMDKVLMMIKGIKRPFMVLELSDMMDNWPMKQWQRYNELIPSLKEMGYAVVGIGKDDKGRNKSIKTDIDLLNMFDPLESAVVMSQAALFIGHEGLLSHIAQTLKIQSIILYGCSSPEYTSDLSLSELHPIISPVGCQGCRHVQNAGVGVICPRENICMEAITVDMVLDAIKTFFDPGLLKTLTT